MYGKLYYTSISFLCGEESALDEIIMDGSDDDLEFDDEIEINEDDGYKIPYSRKSSLVQKCLQTL